MNADSLFIQKHTKTPNCPKSIFLMKKRVSTRTGCYNFRLILMKRVTIYSQFVHCYSFEPHAPSLSVTVIVNILHDPYVLTYLDYIQHPSDATVQVCPSAF